MNHIAYVHVRFSYLSQIITLFWRIQVAANNRRRKDFHTLPIEDRELLESLGYKEKIRKTDEAIAKNAEFLKSIVADPEIFGHDLVADDDHDIGGETPASPSGAGVDAQHGPL